MAIPTTGTQTYLGHVFTGDSYRVNVRVPDPAVAGGTRDLWVDVPGGLADAAAVALAVRAKIEDLRKRESQRDVLAGITPGTTFTVAPPPVSTPSQADVDRLAWLDKARRLIRARDMGAFTGQLATDITALQTDVQNTYVAGYLSSL